ncbi:MAG: penicillin-binding protein 2, partial [Prolixibacteraceae bacterium]|nr:penicillin-binding protein 2 [Prolixibacteraceae bacterium]
HFHESPINLVGGIRESCNTYFWNVFRLIIGNAPTAEEGYEKWRKYMSSFGLGHTIGTELYGESSGNIPLSTYYDHYFLRHHWNALTIRSLSIGQGEIILTPFQMANSTAMIANRGYYITPHFVKSIKTNDGTIRKLKFRKHITPVDTKYFEPVYNGMQQVVEKTNTRYTAYVKGINICGKTGTVQNAHGSDNSAFIAFAPKEHPQIAVAVYVEFGIWGARYAAPIASLIIEKYLTDTIQGANRKYLEKKMFDANLLSPNQPK